MAIAKSRIAVIIVLTVVGAGLFILVLQSRWRANDLYFSVNNKQSDSRTKPSGSGVNKEPDSVLAGSKYWKKAVNIVENLIKDKLRSDSHADPDLSEVWLHQVSNQEGPGQTDVDSVKKSSSEISDEKVKQTSKLPPVSPPRQDLPFLTRGLVEIRPERLPSPAHSSDIYYSLLTAPKFHDLRISLQYLTWLQTVDPKQVSIN